MSVCVSDLEDVQWCEKFAASQPNITFVVDEYSMWYPTATHNPGPGLFAMIRCGRKAKQRVILATQSPGAISKQLTGQAELWIFAMSEPRERMYVLDRTGGMVDPFDLEPLEVREINGEVCIIQARVVKYHAGVRTDYILHTPTATLKEVDAHPTTDEPVPEIPPEVEPDPEPTEM
jgi:hypothetical protein